MKNGTRSDSLKSKPVGEIVSDDYRTAGIFKQYGLDFCCGGKHTLSEACEKKGVDIQQVEQEIKLLGSPGREQPNYNQWSLPFLIDYIINNHHQYVRNKLPEIEGFLDRVSKVHGRQHPELLKIRDKFALLKNEMTEHMKKEEEVVFPFIRQRVDKEQPDDATTSLGTAEEAIALMEEEHDRAGNLMAEMESLSNGFTPPEGACATYRVSYASLAEFQDDLHKHVHLENNILFPQALSHGQEA